MDVKYRMRHLLLTSAILGVLAAPAVAQDSSALDAPVKNFKLPRQVPPCGLAAVLLRLAKETGLRIGIERTADCGGHKARGFPEAYKPLDLTDIELLDGLPAKDVLARLAALVPDYDRAIMEGVAVFRPSAAWKDANDALGARVPAMHFSHAPAARVVGTILNRQAGDGPATLSIDFPGGTVLEALNSLVRSQPAMWYANSDGERLSVWIMNVPADSGLGVTAPLAPLFSRGSTASR